MGVKGGREEGREGGREEGRKGRKEGRKKHGQTYLMSSTTIPAASRAFSWPTRPAPMGCASPVPGSSPRPWKGEGERGRDEKW